MAKVVEREDEGEEIGGAEPDGGRGRAEESSVLGDAEMPEDAGDVGDVEAATTTATTTATSRTTNRSTGDGH